MSTFKIGGPVVGKDFFDREDILADFEKNLIKSRAYIGFALYGLRRIGKTSIIKEFTLRQKRNKNFVPVYIDVSRIHPFTLVNFYDEIFIRTTEELKKMGLLKQSFKETLKEGIDGLIEILKKTEISLHIREYLELRLKFKEKKDLRELLINSFGLTEKISKEKKVRIILILDEFPHVQEFGEKNLIWAIRSIVQEWRYANLIITGSSVSMMKKILTLKNSPFYMLLRVIEVKPFDQQNSEAFIRFLMKRAKLSINREMVSSINSLVDGLPFYIQLLSQKISQFAKKEVKKNTIKKAFDQMLEECGLIFSSDIGKLSSLEKDVLITAVDKKRISLISRALNKKQNIIIKIIGRLGEKGYIKKIKRGTYELIDPVLSRWLAQQS